jgi:SAM-dependent methyltransferase
LSSGGVKAGDVADATETSDLGVTSMMMEQTTTSPEPTPAPVKGGAGSLLRNFLAHPLTRGRDLDDPNTTALRREIIRDKPFLRRIYDEWYRTIADSLPKDVPGKVLELGSGAGYLPEFVPDVITSEIFSCPGIDVVLDAQNMALPDASLKGVVMTDVLHHLPNVRKFFAEATRTVRPGGVIVMIEPWVSGWSKIIYTKLHHEPFRPDADTWDFPNTGPLSGANGALPWIVFQRDRAVFEREFPQWEVQRVRPFMPLRYLVSGGVSMRSLVPSFAFGPIKWAEGLLGGSAAMFVHIVLRRRDDDQPKKS